MRTRGLDAILPGANKYLPGRVWIHLKLPATLTPDNWEYLATVPVKGVLRKIAHVASQVGGGATFRLYKSTTGAVSGATAITSAITADSTFTEERDIDDDTPIVAAERVVAKGQRISLVCATAEIFNPDITLEFEVAE